MFKFCRYCEEIEDKMSTMCFHHDKNGKIIYEDIHESCKVLELENPKQKGEKPKIRGKNFTGLKCKFCNCFEEDESKLYVYVNKNGVKYVRDIHLKCREERDAKNREKEKEKYKIKTKVYAQERVNKNIIDRILEAPDRKTCNHCEREKHISEFYQKRNMSYYGHCKKCHYDKNKKSKDKNSEKRKNYHKIYNEGYLDRMKEDDPEKYFNFIEKRRLKAKLKYQKNKNNQCPNC